MICLSCDYRLKRMDIEQGYCSKCGDSIVYADDDQQWKEFEYVDYHIRS